MGDCQNYGPFSGPYYNTGPNNLGNPKRDHDFDNPPHPTPQFLVQTEVVVQVLLRTWMESLATFGKELAQSSFARVRFRESLRAIRGEGM